MHKLYQTAINEKRKQICSWDSRLSKGWRQKEARAEWLCDDITFINADNACTSSLRRSRGCHIGRSLCEYICFSVCVRNMGGNSCNGGEWASSMLVLMGYARWNRREGEHVSSFMHFQPNSSTLLESACKWKATSAGFGHFNNATRNLAGSRRTHHLQVREECHGEGKRQEDIYDGLKWRSMTVYPRANLTNTLEATVYS